MSGWVDMYVQRKPDLSATGSAAILDVVSTVCVCVVLREGGSFANASGGRGNSPALP